MDKFLVLMVCLTAVMVSSAERMRRQYPNYNQLRPYNTPSHIRPPYQPASWNLNEPLPNNYDFRYDVNAPDYGTNFGHQEQRQGDVSRGKYYVLLPDGRTQTVEYTADQDGYHPTISYQGGGGYDHGGGLTHGGFRGSRYY